MSMSKGGGGEAIKSGGPQEPEAAESIKARKLDRATLLSMRAKLAMTLGLNVLDYTKNAVKGVSDTNRENELYKLATDMVDAPPNKIVYMLGTDEEPTGLIVVKKDEIMATVECIWTSVSAGQPATIRSLVDATLDNLKSGHQSYNTLHLNTDRTIQSRCLELYLKEGLSSRLIVGEATSPASNDDVGSSGEGSREKLAA